MRYIESSTESSLATPSFTRIAGGIPTYLTVLRSPKKAFPPLYSQTKLAKSYPHERANSSATLFSSALYPALPIFITQLIQRQRYKLTTNNTTKYTSPQPDKLYEELRTLPIGATKYEGLKWKSIEYCCTHSKTRSSRTSLWRQFLQRAYIQTQSHRCASALSLYPLRSLRLLFLPYHRSWENNGLLDQRRTTSQAMGPSKTKAWHL